MHRTIIVFVFFYWQGGIHLSALSSLTGDIRFRYEGGGYAARQYPNHIQWRQLPYALIESPEGGQWILTLEGTAPVTIRSGEVMVIPRGVRHTFYMHGAKSMQTYWFMGAFDGLGGLDALAAAGIPRFLPSRAGTRLTPLIKAAGELDAAVNAGMIAAMAKRQRIGFKILETLIDYADTKTLAPVNPALKRILPALQYVESNLAKSISTVDMASQTFLSPSRFYAVFGDAMGMSPMAYVQDTRLRQAQHLLLATELPIGEVATQTGFASPYYFSRVFRRCLRTTPTAFRRSFSFHYLLGGKSERQITLPRLHHSQPIHAR